MAFSFFFFSHFREYVAKAQTNIIQKNTFRCSHIPQADTKLRPLMHSFMCSPNILNFIYKHRLSLHPPSYHTFKARTHTHKPVHNSSAGTHSFHTSEKKTLVGNFILHTRNAALIAEHITFMSLPKFFRESAVGSVFSQTQPCNLLAANVHKSDFISMKVGHRW